MIEKEVGSNVVSTKHLLLGRIGREEPPLNSLAIVSRASVLKAVKHGPDKA